MRRGVASQVGSGSGGLTSPAFLTTAAVTLVIPLCAVAGLALPGRVIESVAAPVFGNSSRAARLDELPPLEPSDDPGARGTISVTGRPNGAPGLQA